MIGVDFERNGDDTLQHVHEHRVDGTADAPDFRQESEPEPGGGGGGADGLGGGAPEAAGGDG